MCFRYRSLEVSPDGNLFLNEMKMLCYVTLDFHALDCSAFKVFASIEILFVRVVGERIKCNECHRSYSSRSNLNAHVKKKHVLVTT